MPSGSNEKQNCVKIGYSLGRLVQRFGEDDKYGVSE